MIERGDGWTGTSSIEMSLKIHFLDSRSNDHRYFILRIQERRIQYVCRGCYPRYLGITRRSCLEAHMVLDMEYREQERFEHGPGGPIFLLLS
jgi:hypothetical protein